MPVAQMAAEALVEGGVRRAFVVASNQNLRVLDALLEAGVDCRPARCEVGAVHAADGHARMRGDRTAVVTSTGPGAGNAVGAFCTAAKDASRVVHVTTTHFPGGPAAQGVHTIHDQGGWARAMGAPVIDLAQSGRDHLAAALAAEPGALTVIVPDDDARSCALSVPPAPHARRPRRPLGDAQPAIDQWLASSRPLLWLGGGVRAGDRGRLASVARRSGAAVVTSVQAKDVYAGEHPNFAGCTLQSQLTRDAVAGSDACLALGSRMSELSTSAWAPGFPDLLVRIAYTDEQPPFDGVEILDHPVDVVDVIDYLDGVLPASPPTDFGARCGERARAGRAAKGRAGDEYAILDGIGSALRPGDALVCDMTKLAFWALLALDVSPGTRFMFPGMLNMGFGLPAGVGASHASPDAHVVVLTGDGGLLSILPELDAAASVPGRLTIILVDDDGYGLLRPFASDGVNRAMCSFRGPDWAQVAAGFGCDVIEARNGDEVAAALRSTGARVRLIRIDGTDLCRENWRTA